MRLVDVQRKRQDGLAEGSRDPRLRARAILTACHPRNDAGSDGETLAFKPADGLLYHASGAGDRNTDAKGIFESIQPGTLATALCDANDDGLCKMSDIVGANREIFSQGNTSICERRAMPGP